MTRDTQATILRMCITQMADSYAYAAADFATYSALRCLHPDGGAADLVEKARRAKHRRRAALDRLNRALANLAKGA